MRTGPQICIVVLISQISCGRASTFESEDSNGDLTTLSTFSAIETWPKQSGLIQCSAKTAAGRYTVASPDPEFDPITLDFCFGEESEAGFAPDARYFRDDTSVNICLPREDGYCEGEECVTVAFYDNCSAFSLVDNDA